MFGRLLGIATLTTLAALAFAAVSIGHVLERFVIRSLDQQLDTEVQMLAHAVRPEGVLDGRRIVNLPASKPLVAAGVGGLEARAAGGRAATRSTFPACPAAPNRPVRTDAA